MMTIIKHSLFAKVKSLCMSFSAPSVVLVYFKGPPLLYAKYAFVVIPFYKPRLPPNISVH